MGYKKKIALAVVEQFLNMIQNDVVEDNRFESFMGWLADGEVFWANGMSDDIDNLHWKFAQMCDTM